MHNLIAATATATSAMSIGTGDRGENETKYLQDAQFLLNKMINEDDREGQCELVSGRFHIRQSTTNKQEFALRERENM